MDAEKRFDLGLGPSWFAGSSYGPSRQDGLAEDEKSAGIAVFRGYPQEFTGVSVPPKL
jgi:hypothetical protein